MRFSVLPFQICTCEYGFLLSALNGFGGAVGFAVAIILMAGIRERVEENDHPKAFEGFPFALITAGLMSIAFLGSPGTYQCFNGR